MIKKLNVVGLNKRFNFNKEFYPDLNIFTGKNGCGKTTLLKLIWYLNSGNLRQLFKEITFDKVYFKADTIEANLEIIDKDNTKFVIGNYKTAGGEFKADEPVPINDFDFDRFVLNVGRNEKSIFFPTFRRIEGGFSINEEEEIVVDRNGNRIRLGRRDDLNAAFNHLSEKLTMNRENKFIASISTTDIIQLLNEKYALNLEQIRKLENKQSASILDKIRKRDRVKEDSIVLLEIEELVKETDNQKDTILKPFTVLSNLIHEIFIGKSIEITRTLTLGEAQDAIKSDKLSAGEKQMLSFLCYNFFSEKHSIFIDEPELSLHTDWQRILFPTLLEQGTDNQFFIATHSPFIYSKYPDKEHILDNDKGGKL